MKRTYEFKTATPLISFYEKYKEKMKSIQARYMSLKKPPEERWQSISKDTAL